MSAPRKRRALCIGTNFDHEPEIQLYGCENDAFDWAELFRVLSFDTVDLIVGRQATKENILGEIERFAGLTKAGDTLVVTGSMHGSRTADRDGDETDGWDEGWCSDDILDIRQLVTDDELSEALATPVGSWTRLISDACHTGGFARAHAELLADPGPLVRYLPPSVWMDDEHASAALLARSTLNPRVRPGSLALSACQSDEVCWDGSFGGRPNGVFTRAAIDTITEDMTWAQWRKAILMVVPNRQFIQHAVLEGSTRQQRRQALVG